MILICLKTCYKFCWKLALISLHSETCLSYVFHMFFICPGGQLLWLLRSFGRGWMPRCRHLSHTCAAAGRTRIFCGGMSPGMSMMALGHALTVSNLAKPFSIQLDISSEYKPLYSLFIYIHIYIYWCKANRLCVWFYHFWPFTQPSFLAGARLPFNWR